MNRKLFIVVVVILFLTAAGYFGYRRYTYVSTDDAYVQAHTAMLAPKVGGVVNQVLVEEHQKVKAGQILVALEDKDYRAALANAEANLGALTAQYVSSKADFQRSESLVRQKAISRQAYDHARAAFQDIDRRVKAAQAEVDQARLNLEYTRLRAPTDGFIARKSVEVGMYASSGSSLVGFVQDDERWVIANFKETDLPSIEVGKKVRVSVDAIDDRDFQGLVESISPSTGATFTLFPPENATGNFTKVVQRVPVRIHLKNLRPEDFDRLQAGLSAVVDVYKHSKPQPLPPYPNPEYISQQAGSLPPAQERASH
jgi:membrane fusion protein (multidrug efflux system)